MSLEVFTLPGRASLTFSEEIQRDRLLDSVHAMVVVCQNRDGHRALGVSAMDPETAQWLARTLDNYSRGLPQGAP